MRTKKIKPIIQPESAIQDVEVVEVAEILNETAKTIDELRLKPEWRVFVQEYTYDWNGSRAYKVAYPNCKDDTARNGASQLITNPHIKQAIQIAQKDLERLCGISKQMVLREEMKIAFSSIAHLHNTWMERKDFEELTEDQKACIQEIDTKVVQDKEGTTVYFKIKLYDKQKSLEAIRKMLGYNEEKALVNVEVNNNTQNNNYYASVKDALQSAGILKPKP
jgi:phage terminase small subunit